MRQRCGHCRPSDIDVWNFASLVSGFLFGAPSWRLSSRLLVRLNFPAARKTARMSDRSWQQWRFRPGRTPHNLCTSLIASCRGKVLRVTGTVREVDVSAVSASIDSDEFFARGASSGAQRRSAWHCVKIHNHARTMNAVESANERVGSVMGGYYNKHTHPNASFVLDRVMLHEADVQCAGSPQDEELVGVVASTFQRLGLTPDLCERSHRRRRERQAQDAALGRADALDAASSSDADSSGESAVGAGGHASEALLRYEFRGDVAEAAVANRARALPDMSLTPGLRRALTGPGEVVKPQRLFHDLQRSQADGAGDRLAKWMGGEEGRAWLIQRETRLRAHLPRGIKP